LEKEKRKIYVYNERKKCQEIKDFFSENEIKIISFKIIFFFILLIILGVKFDNFVKRPTSGLDLS
jgi:predicted negative regulator of RcsB-dependent stress response